MVLALTFHKTTSYSCRGLVRENLGKKREREGEFRVLGGFRGVEDQEFQ